MLIFDEKKYAQSLLKNKEFKTYRQKDIERYILIRYLASQDMSFDDIKKQLEKENKPSRRIGKNLEGLENIRGDYFCFRRSFNFFFHCSV